MSKKPSVSDRYGILIETLRSLVSPAKHNVIFMEIGTYDGKRAADLCRYWKKMTDGGTFAYVGFDLFEDMTPATNLAELSKSTLPPAKAVAAKTLREAGAETTLIKGNTRDTIPSFVTCVPDFAPDVIFVDGGHSLETVQSDWDAIQPIVRDHTIVLFDDFYENRNDYGCGPLVRKLAWRTKAWQVDVLDPVDVIPVTDLKIRMARVRPRTSVPV